VVSLESTPRSYAPWLRGYLPAFMIGCNLVLGYAAVAQEGTLEDRKSQWTTAAKELRRAGELFRENQFDECKQIVEGVIGSIKVIPPSSDPVVMSMQGKVQKGIDRARELLKKQGIDIDEGTGGTREPLVKDAQGTSFVRDVVPIIMDKCGKCHVDRAAGEVTLATYEALIAPNGTGVGIVVPENADESYFLEVIVSGEMPKGKKKITPAELTILKKWIQEGAPFDGSDPTTTLDALAESS
jgi:Planctomycete cytochrome C